MYNVILGYGYIISIKSTLFYSLAVVWYRVFKIIVGNDTLTLELSLAKVQWTRLAVLAPVMRETPL